MKKIINTAPMAVITTQHTPWSVLLTLKPLDNGTYTQAQDVTKNLWSPDRRITPLVIEPVFSAYDKDMNQEVTVEPAYVWYVNGSVVPPSATAADDYYIIGQGSELKAGCLVVRKNVAFDEPVTIRCIATYQEYTADETVLLTTENKPEIFYQVDVMTPNTVEFHPLTDATSQKTFKAFVQHGNEALVWENVIGKSINAVDLGSLAWSLSEGVFSAVLTTKAKTDGGAALAGYEQDQPLAADKTISTSDGDIRIKDAAYSSADDFRAAMYGKVLFYELATKTVNESFATAMRKTTGFFWYLDGELITKDTYGYVSGQGMETLILDADYIDNSMISVKLAIPTFEGGSGDASTVTMPTSPSSNAKAQSGLVWIWDNVTVLPTAVGGNYVSQFSENKDFDSVAKVNAKDLTAAVRAKYIKTRWYTHATDDIQSVKTYYGYSSSVQIPVSALRRTSGINVEVGVDVYLLGYKHPVTDPETGEITLVQDEVLIENPTPPVVITTRRTVLSTLFTIKTNDDGTLTQHQDLTKNMWIPNRAVNPLMLTPVFVAINDNGEQEALNIEYKWYANGSRITTTMTNADYYLATDGGSLTGDLVVRTNVNWERPVTIKCEVTYTDNLRIETFTEQKEVLLTTESNPDTLYIVTLNVPNTITYHPLTDETSTFDIHAAVQYGKELLGESAQIAYFWYIDDELVTEDTIGVVGGIGTSTLVVDAEFFDGVTITARIGIPYYPSESSSTPVLPNEPNINPSARCGLVWDYEKPVPVPVGLGGNVVRANSGEKHFDSVIQVGAKDVSEEKRRKFVRTQWFKHSTEDVQDDRTMYDWGAQTTLPPEELLTSGNVNTEIGVDMYVLGPYKAVVDEATGLRVVDDKTGKVVVMND